MSPAVDLSSPAARLRRLAELENIENRRVIALERLADICEKIAHKLGLNGDDEPNLGETHDAET